MSTIAKVLVVVIFFLSVAFAVVSGQIFAKREKLLEEYDKLKTDHAEQVGKLKGDNEKLSGANDSLSDDISKKDSEIQKLTSDVNNLQGSNKKLTDDVNDYKAWRNGIETQLNQLRDEVKNKNTRLEEAEKTLNATRDQLRGAQEQARQQELEAKKATQAAKEAQQRQKDLEVALKDAKTKIEIYKQGGAAADETGMVQAPIDALIIKVDQPSNLVVINKGRDQGVEVGYVFTVYRGDTYLGDVKIENVAATVAAGSPVVGTTIGTIREGDNASTRIR